MAIPFWRIPTVRVLPNREAVLVHDTASLWTSNIHARRQDEVEETDNPTFRMEGLACLVLRQNGSFLLSKASYIRVPYIHMMWRGRMVNGKEKELKELEKGEIEQLTWDKPDKRGARAPPQRTEADPTMLPH